MQNANFLHWETLSSLFSFVGLSHQWILLNTTKIRHNQRPYIILWVSPLLYIPWEFASSLPKDISLKRKRWGEIVFPPLLLFSWTLPPAGFSTLVSSIFSWNIVKNAKLCSRLHWLFVSHQREYFHL